jgi:hypothetical protein
MKWKYRVERWNRRHDASTLEANLDEAGRDGWELVAITYAHHADHETTLIVTFKRLLELS